MRHLQLPRSVLAWLLVAAGFAVIGAGWAGVQSTAVVAVQLAYLASGGFVGVALVIVGVGLVYQEDLHVSREILEELRDRFDDLEHDLADLRADVVGRPAQSRGRAS